MFKGLCILALCIAYTLLMFWIVRAAQVLMLVWTSIKTFAPVTAVVGNVLVQESQRVTYASHQHHQTKFDLAPVPAGKSDLELRLKASPVHKRG